MAIELQLKPQARDLGGGMQVRRLLPAVQRRSVGPFVFLDHFGPVQAHDSHDVRPHPHIGLATVTYLFEGAMMHRDSLGFNQRIEPGAINWMSAGRGIVHSERQPDDLRGQSYANHGMQLWLAVPASHEEEAPSFAHTPAEAIPCVELPGAQVRVLIGEAFGAHSPVATVSPTLYLDIQLQAGRQLALPALAPEMALYPVEGELDIDGVDAPVHQLAVLDGPSTLRAHAATRCMLVGGAPLEGPRFLWWNFVSSRRERIVQAAQDWKDHQFPGILGETDFIPLPERAPLPAQDSPL